MIVVVGYLSKKFICVNNTLYLILTICANINSLGLDSFSRQETTTQQSIDTLSKDTNLLSKFAILAKRNRLNSVWCIAGCETTIEMTTLSSNFH